MCKKQPLEVFCKKGVFKDFAILMGRHLCVLVTSLKHLKGKYKNTLC